MSDDAAKTITARQQIGYAFAVVGLLGVVGAILIGIRWFVPIATYRVASASMEPTLHEGDVVLVKGARELCGSIQPTLGDVAIFRRGDTRYIHRVVAESGQTVAMRRGHLVVDGAELPRQASGERKGEYGRAETVIRETQPNGASYETLDFGPDGDLDNVAPKRVADGNWFILGDNRDNALDSRVLGAVSQRDVCGVVISILSSTEAAHVGRKP